MNRPDYPVSQPTIHSDTVSDRIHRNCDIKPICPERKWPQRQSPRPNPVRVSSFSVTSSYAPFPLAPRLTYTCIHTPHTYINAAIDTSANLHVNPPHTRCNFANSRFETRKTNNGKTNDARIENGKTVSSDLAPLPPRMDQPVINGNADVYESICCRSAYARHSFEVRFPSLFP